ncbi:MAG: tryptophan--tRNA ligase [Patescibacteria group bacterium]
MEGKEIVLSGIRATNRLHIGSYIGAVQKFAKLSRDPTMRCFYFIADQHTLTTLQDARLIQKFLPHIVLDYLAAGVDIQAGAIIFAQSSIPETSQLASILACFTPVGDLLRVPSYKEKADQTGANAGLLNYPVLMAADILGPKATIIPVGKDQQPHLELAREAARRFNHFAKRDVFPVPEGRLTTVVPGLGAAKVNEDGSVTFSKMSKSEGGTINLSDTPEEVWEKLRHAPTDPARVKRTDSGTPEVCPIYALHQHFTPLDEMLQCAEGCRTASIGCLDCKEVLAGHVNALLQPFQKRRVELERQNGLVQDVLATGARRAREMIVPTVEEVKDVVGLPRINGG